MADSRDREVHKSAVNRQREQREKTREKGIFRTQKTTSHNFHTLCATRIVSMINLLATRDTALYRCVPGTELCNNIATECFIANDKL